jgi:hypothetical protein
VSLSKRLRFEVLKRDNFTCQYCGAKPPDTVLEIDHVHPRCEGGKDEMSNLKTACWNCNRGKAGVPLVDLWTYELFGNGPVDGTYTFSRKGCLPALWVVTDDTGVIVTLEDERNDYDSDEWAEDHKLFVLGHPAHHTGETGADGMPTTGWYYNSAMADRHPKTLGIYCDLQVPRPDGKPQKKLKYMDVDWLLMEVCW